MTQQSEEARKRRKIVITVKADGKMLVRFYQGKRLTGNTSFGPRREQLTIDSGFAFPLLERFSGLGLGLGSGSGSKLRASGMTGFAAPESVITSLAGFGLHRPQPLGGRTAIPAAFRYTPAVSRRIPVSGDNQWPVLGDR